MSKESIEGRRGKLIKRVEYDQNCGKPRYLPAKTRVISCPDVASSLGIVVRIEGTEKEVTIPMKDAGAINWEQ